MSIGYDLIQKGIDYNDMDLVAQGLELLKTVLPGDAMKNADSVPQTLKKPEPAVILDRPGSQAKGDDFAFQIRQQNNDRSHAEGGQYTRTEQIDVNKVAAFNMFQDDMSEEQQDTKESISERSGGKTLYNRPRTPRKASVVFVDIECVGGCNKTFNVHPAFARTADGESRYLCDKCIKNRGRRVENIPRM